MKQQIRFITIGVEDLEGVKYFYQNKFGWQIIKDSDGIVLFKMNGYILSLIPLAEFASDADVLIEKTRFKGFTLAINFESKEEVYLTFNDLKENKVNIVKSPEIAFWGGYSGYIEDPENNLWEIACNPFLELDDIGKIISDN